MAYSIRQFTEEGANPFVVEGPVTLGQGVFAPSYDLGTVVSGDNEAEYVYCRLVLGSSTTLRDGQLYTYDKDFTCSLVTTSNSPRGQSCGVGRFDQSTALPAGTYFIWLQRAGHCPIRYTGSNNAIAETTATGGLVNFTNTPTTTTKQIVGLYLLNGGNTFTANTTNGSNILTNISSFNDVCLGATLTGTGVAGLTVNGIFRQGVALGGGGQPNVPFGQTPDTILLSGNASATGSAVTMTQTVTATANILWPYIDKTN